MSETAKKITDVLMENGLYNTEKNIEKIIEMTKKYFKRKPTQERFIEEIFSHLCYGKRAFGMKDFSTFKAKAHLGKEWDDTPNWLVTQMIFGYDRSRRVFYLKGEERIFSNYWLAVIPKDHPEYFEKKMSDEEKSEYLLIQAFDPGSHVLLEFRRNILNRTYSQLSEQLETDGILADLSYEIEELVEEEYRISYGS